jgi:hypothetical protein
MSSDLKLTIKAANQKFSDYVVESCELDWSIRRLKQHLSDNYPKNPVNFDLKNKKSIEIKNK